MIGVEMKLLSDVPLGGVCRVSGFAQSGPVKTRVLQMGLVPGTVVEVMRPAPMGDPMSVRFRGMEVSLRRQEASAVRVEMVSPCGGCAGCCGGCTI
ncbi:FeoA family protein [Thermanaerovibrio acidaminovorans]|nr:FeoA family protein [Thermanaerovibrio acidaminovorans]